MTDILASLAYQLSKPIAEAKVKAQACDFQVMEDLGFDFSGNGEHLMVKIRKQGENTSYVANELAKACGVPSKNVGWAGLKDRHAITEQWLSVQGGKKDDFNIAQFEAEHPTVQILETAYHHKKLRPGDLIGNQFVIRLTEVSNIEDICQRLEQIKLSGVPNYYGAQRFGQDGNNLEEARRWGRENVRTRNQNKRSLYLSTARSWIFNQVVSHRIEAQLFSQLLNGDIVINSKGDQSVVDETNLAELQVQLENETLQLSAPLAGDNALPTRNDAQQLEKPFLDAEPDLMKLICGNRMRHDRRPVALYAQNLTWSTEATAVTLSFGLPAGCFATSILRELINEIAFERTYD
ncbi:tRNA pseudouridine(13) synthase TruD [Vibrio sp. S17_S38]|uniref:tRNA pseudouridine(13) synthase TruD n=1 Tax=Vibrio sp. S17_S38 TaxID=2720229 RepID=UPI00168109A3|nr:tRNA pseudouridine(13) synthase TruD [Vibrio sp. S17_S38]MBD1573650.1 tRNA pseudouridine(13) synthase TruD [Vibrio sp. S17_S38]